MFCPKCGVELRDGAKFCPKCGTDLSKRQRAGEVQKEPKDEAANAASSFAERFRQQSTTANAPTRESSDATARTQAPSAETTPVGAEGANGYSIPTTANLPLLGVDLALFLLLVAVPWVGSYYIDYGKSESLLGITINALKLFGEMSKYSSYASGFGAGDFYGTAMGYVLLVGILCGAGLLLVAKSLYNDAKCDYRGTTAPGNSGYSLAALAIVVQVAAWVSVAIAQEALKNDYVNLSGLADGIVQTTIWVWISIAAGFATAKYRQKVSKG